MHHLNWTELIFLIIMKITFNNLLECCVHLCIELYFQILKKLKITGQLHSPYYGT